MLACSQDLYFSNDKPLARQDLLPATLQQQQPQPQSSQMPSNLFDQQEPNFVKKTSHMIQHHISEKDKEEQVWPPEVESAFIEALETIPKLGRRKILVNGKPCGRNELISDFIFRKTSKVRTRKQVSSHIQVLKNTRKNDPHFMRLLTDSVDLEDDYTHRKTPKSTAGKRPQPKHQPPFLNPNSNSTNINTNNNTNTNTNTNTTNKSNLGSLPLGKFANLNSTASISSDESSIQSSPSPADYVFDMMYGDEHAALSMLDIKDPFYDTINSSFFDANLGMTTPSSHPSFAFAPASSSSSSSTPPQYSFMHPSSSTGMTTPSLMDSACFELFSPMDTTACAQFVPNDMCRLQSGNIDPPYGPQQQQQQQQQQQLKSQQQLVQPYFPSNQPPLHTDEVMVEPLRSSLIQSRKWKRGNRRQKHAMTQHSRNKGYQHYAVHRPSPFMNQYQHKNANSVTTTTIDTMPIMNNTNNTIIPMTLIPSASSNAVLWPNYLCLYLEYYDASSDTTTATNTNALDPAMMANSHTLAQLPHCSPSTVQSDDDLSNGTSLKERYNSLLQLNPSLSFIPSDVTLFAKMKLDLNYNMDNFYFNNTCFFESKDRRMIECTTTIYSFGNVVLESKEMKQALWTPDNKYMYSFAYVNQFFDAFMKGVKSLQSWEEVDIAIHNLCIVQVFEDMETKCQLLDHQQQQQQQEILSTGSNYSCNPSLHESSSSLSSSSSSSSTTATSSSSSTTATSSSSSTCSTSTASSTLFDSNNAPLKSSYTNNGGHLLAIIYEFERGQGVIDMTALHDTNDTIHDSA